METPQTERVSDSTLPPCPCSHDLRTPCHGMQCASQLLAACGSVASDGDALYLLKAVSASCALLMGTINNVLDLKMLEAEADLAGPAAAAAAAAQQPRPPRKRDALHPVALFADVLDVCRVACSKDIAWSNEAHTGEYPATLEGNPERLRQVIQNVCTVCIRNAGACAVVARLSCTQLPHDEDSLAHGSVARRASFFAEGRVLSAEEERRAFEPYTDCAGLALLVARTFARRCDGDVTVTATPRGTCFELHVRLFEPGAPPIPAPPPALAAPAVPHAPPPNASPPQAASPPPPPPPPPPLPHQLRARMFAHLVEHSDDVFHMGQFAPDGMHIVRAHPAFALLRLRCLHIDARIDEIAVCARADVCEPCL
jgi:hypothetical protein